MNDKERILTALETIGDFCSFEDCNKCFLNAANLFDHRIDMCTLGNLDTFQYSQLAMVAREFTKKGPQEANSEYSDDWDD